MKLKHLTENTQVPPVQAPVRHPGSVLIYQNNAIKDWPAFLSIQRIDVTHPTRCWHFYKVVRSGLRIDATDFERLVEEGHFVPTDCTSGTLKPSTTSEAMHDTDSLRAAA